MYHIWFQTWCILLHVYMSMTYDVRQSLQHPDHDGAIKIHNQDFRMCSSESERLSIPVISFPWQQHKTGCCCHWIHHDNIHQCCTAYRTTHWNSCLWYCMFDTPKISTEPAMSTESSVYLSNQSGLLISWTAQGLVVVRPGEFQVQTGTYFNFKWFDWLGSCSSDELTGGNMG